MPRPARVDHLVSIYASANTGTEAVSTSAASPAAGVSVAAEEVPDPGSQIQDPGSQIPDPGSQIPDPGSQIREATVLAEATVLQLAEGVESLRKRRGPDATSEALELLRHGDVRTK